MLLFGNQIFSFELTYIKGVSKTHRTFVTRNGKSDGIFVGKKMTFTTDDISLIAIAKTVSREFTQWEIENRLTEAPFENGDLVTLYETDEYLWALNPHELHQAAQKKYAHLNRNSYSFNSAFTKGISDSVSEVVPQSNVRGSWMLDGNLEHEFNLSFSLLIGLRYESETTNIPEASILSQRLIFTLEPRYYFEEMEKLYQGRIFLALVAGYGESLTETTGLDTSGNATLLPSPKIGLQLPLKEQSFLTFDVAIENFSIVEFNEAREKQTTDMSNARFGIGYKKYLDLF